MNRAALIVLTVLTATPALAATPQAYEEVDRASSLACLRATGFRDAAFAPAPLRFSDRMGMDARLVTGTYAQPHMKGQQGMMLCLYNRKTKLAEAIDAAPWMSRKQPWTAPPTSKKK